MSSTAAEPVWAIVALRLGCKGDLRNRFLYRTDCAQPVLARLPRAICNTSQPEVSPATMKGPRCKPIAISYVSDLNWEFFSCVIDDDLKAVCMTPDGKIVHLVGRKPGGVGGVGGNGVGVGGKHRQTRVLIARRLDHEDSTKSCYDM